ncbi:MAG: hypothetical protein ABIQ18_39720 [Umezawaea sp.]
MEFFYCTENKSDRLGVAQYGDMVLVVITEVASDTPAEARLSSTSARKAATALRGIVDGSNEEGAHVGLLWVGDGHEDDTVLVTGIITRDDARGVLLSYPDAGRLADVLDATATYAEMHAMVPRQETAPVDEATRDAMAVRMYALEMTNKALGGPPIDLVAAAHWVATGEVSA